MGGNLWSQEWVNIPERFLFSPQTGLLIPTNCILVRIVPEWVTTTKKNEFLSVTQEEFFFNLNLHVVYIFKQAWKLRGFTLPEQIQSWVLLSSAACLKGLSSDYLEWRTITQSPFLSSHAFFHPSSQHAWVDSLPMLMPSFTSNHISPPIPPHDGQSNFPPFQSSPQPCLILSSNQVLCSSLHITASVNFLCGSFLHSFLEK